jgi:hypothetical protein
MADGNRLLSGASDSTAMLWDLGAGHPAEHVALDATQLEQCWNDLAGSGAKAYQAIIRLSRSPEQAVPYLTKQITPAPALDDAAIGKLIAALDSDQFETREQADRQLRAMDERIAPRLRKSIDGNISSETRKRLETILESVSTPRADRTDNDLCSIRAIEVLERIASPDAVKLLKNIAAGALGSRRTDEATATLTRMAKRPVPAAR